MKYKFEYQFRWLLVLLLIGLIYASNLVMIKLPFIRLSFPSFYPEFHFEFYIYNIQTVLVWSIGILFGARAGLLTLGIYIFLGMSGIPVFANGGGIDYFKEPTFGYLISLPLLAFLSGKFYEENKKLMSVFVPIFLTHLLGIIYLLLFKQQLFALTWVLSFSMISYDLIFALLLIPVLPFISFFINELFIQEVPTRDSFETVPFSKRRTI